MMIETNTACMLFLSGILVFSGGCSSKDRSPKRTKKNNEYQMNWSTFNLKGKVKSIREENYKQSVPDNMFDSYVTKQHFFFDTTGNATRIVTFLENESFHTDYHYTYDDAGNYVTLVSYAEDGAQKFRATFEFDDQGRLIDKAEYAPELSYHNVYSYQTLPGGYTQRTQQVVPRSSESFYKHLIDSLEGKLVLEVYFDDINGPPNRREVSRFDKRGDIIETLEYNETETNPTRGEFEYNERHQSTLRKFQSPSFNLNNLEYRWTYDTLGSMTSYQRIKDGNISPTSYRTTYTYDDHGNWIHKETHTWEGAPRTQLDRQIEYYE